LVLFCHISVILYGRGASYRNNIMGNGMKVSSTDIQGLQAQPTSIHIMARWSLRTASPEDLLQLVTCLLLSMIFHIISTISPALGMLARYGRHSQFLQVAFFAVEL
jgi:hypothetical protein